MLEVILEASKFHGEGRVMEGQASRAKKMDLTAKEAQPYGDPPSSGFLPTSLKLLCRNH